MIPNFYKDKKNSAAIGLFHMCFIHMRSVSVCVYTPEIFLLFSTSILLSGSVYLFAEFILEFKEIEALSTQVNDANE